MDRFVLISGCSGGGKSTLLAALAGRGFSVVEEPGRRIVAAEMRGEGKALPWVDPVAFARRAIALSIDDLTKAERSQGWVFFDRGLIDAAIALEHLTGEPATQTLGARRRYHRRVFLAPPWPEIFAQDQERRHDFAAATAEYDRLSRAFPALGYHVDVLPKAPVQERADWLLATLGD